MTGGIRTIHTRACSHQVPDLLQVIFTTELIRPSSDLWLVAPWVSDIPILDNSDLAFRALEPNWPRSLILLSTVLRRLGELGTSVRVVVGPSKHNQYIRDSLKAISGIAGNRITVSTDDMNHSKGILGDRFFLSGSMNLTNNGIGQNGETVHFHLDPAQIAATRLEFQARWPGGTT